MKKALIIGCSVIGVLALIVVLICGGLTIFGGAKFMSNNTKIVEEMIGNKIPEGFTPIFAFDIPDKSDPTQPGKFAMLTYKMTQFVMLAEGPTLAEDQKENFLKNLQSQQQEQSKDLNFKREGTIKIKDKEYPRFDVSETTSSSTKGIATFIDYPNKTFFFVYFAEQAFYDENTVMTFLNAVQLP